MKGWLSTPNHQDDANEATTLAAHITHHKYTMLSSITKSVKSSVKGWWPQKAASGAEEPAAPPRKEKPKAPVKPKGPIEFELSDIRSNMSSGSTNRGHVPDAAMERDVALRAVVSAGPL